MGVITINNKTYIGNSLEVRNGKVYVDGKFSKPGEKDTIVSIHVTGDLELLTADNCNKIEILGNVSGSVDSKNGDIKVEGDIKGSATSKNGDITCKGDINGSATSKNGNIY
jgi:hypothetical protein